MEQTETLSESLRVPVTPAMREELQAVAKANHRKPATEVRVALIEYLERQKAAA